MAPYKEILSDDPTQKLMINSCPILKKRDLEAIGEFSLTISNKCIVISLALSGTVSLLLNKKIPMQKTASGFNHTTGLQTGIPKPLFHRTHSSKPI